MSPSKQDLEALFRLGQELNAETEDLNGTIAYWEDVLRKSGIGASIWINVGHTEEVENLNVVPEGYPEGYPIFSQWELGFSRPYGEWGLFARRYFYAEDWAENNNNTVWFANADPTLLRDAPRPVRIEAMSKLDDLLAAFKAEGERLKSLAAEANAKAKLD